MSPGVPENRSSSKLLAEHRELMKRVADVVKWWTELEQIGIPHYHEMGTRLEALRHHLAEHMAEEEKGGYLAEALEVAPRFSREAEELRLQHAEILQAFDDFIGRLMEKEPPFASWQEVRDEFDTLMNTVRQHERRENAIVQSAFGDDLGRGD